jgi:CheY-like chemotaxis protein
MQMNRFPRPGTSRPAGAAAAPRGASGNSWHSVQTTLALSRLKVLIVDDERSVVKLVQMMLREMGVTMIQSAANGNEALTLLNTTPEMVNLVICDWNMPAMTGIELLRRVRATRPEMAFIMATGRATADSVLDAKALNVNAYIAKPFSQEEMRRKVEALAMTQMASEDEAASANPEPGTPG